MKCCENGKRIILKKKQLLSQRAWKRHRKHRQQPCDVQFNLNVIELTALCLWISVTSILSHIPSARKIFNLKLTLGCTDILSVRGHPFGRIPQDSSMRTSRYDVGTRILSHNTNLHSICCRELTYIASVDSLFREIRTVDIPFHISTISTYYVTN